MKPTLPVIICMGSSCFSRGNNRNIEVIQELAASTSLSVTIEPRGHLCEGLCKQGPNLIIAGKLHHEADPVSVAGAINAAILKTQDAS